MPYWALRLLDAGFYVFHTSLILFNVLGWAWRRTRRWNLALLVLTLVSWVVMGLWHGIGYCVCTDWHFQVRTALGHTDNPGSYVQLLVYKLTGILPEAHLTAQVSGTVFIACLLLSIGLNIRDAQARRLNAQAS